MTISKKQIEYYRSEIISKYVIPIINKYANEEREYNAKIKRINRMLKGVKK